MLCVDMMEDLNIDSNSSANSESEESDGESEQDPKIKFMKWGKDERNTVKMMMKMRTNTGK